MRLSLISIFVFITTVCIGQPYVINSVPYFIPSIADRTAGNKLGYSSGIVCTGYCMIFNSVFTRLPGSISLQAKVLAPPAEPCTCGGSIRCGTTQLKTDTTEANLFYAFSSYPLDYYSPRDNQNEIFVQFKNSYTGQSNLPNISLWNRPLGSSLTKVDLIIEVDTVNATQLDPTQTILFIDTLGTNVWTDYLFEIKWASDYTGYVKVYQNGILKQTYNGPTKDKAYNPSRVKIPNCRPEIYKFTYCQAPGTINTTSKTMFYDVIRIGNSNTSKPDYIIPSTPAPQPPTDTIYNNPVITLPTSSATFNAASSTPVGTIPTKQWTQIGGPASATIVSPNSDTTNITGLSVAGTYTFKYKVTNTAGLSDSALGTIIVNPAPPPLNLPPVVTMSRPKITLTSPQDTLSLTATATDSDGTIASYQWVTTVGAIVTFGSPTSNNTTVSGLATGSYILTLTATDDDGATGSATVTVEVLAAPIPNNGARLRLKGF